MSLFFAKTVDFKHLANFAVLFVAVITGSANVAIYVSGQKL